MTLKINNLQQRERGDDRCSNPKCRQGAEVMYQRGATLLNPTRAIQLCDAHTEEFVLALRKHYVSQPGGLRVVPYVDKGNVDDAEQESGE